MKKIIKNTIYHENCLDTMSKMDNDFADCVITSPPYNMNLRIRNGQYTSRQIVKEFSTKYEGFDDNLPIKDFYNLHSSILNELLRVSPLIFYVIQIVTGSKRAFFRIIGDFNEYLKDIIILDKGSAQPAMQKQVLNRQSEFILIFDKHNGISRQFEQAVFERGTLSDIWRINRGKKASKYHGAVFAESLVEKILENFTNEGQMIYDPFMGTGTTACVAKKMRRLYIGSEIIKDYYDIAIKRVNNISDTSVLSF